MSSEILKKGDFIELHYAGSLKENNVVFDTTDADVAKKHGIHTGKTEYGPVIICIGQHQVVSGLDEQLVGKEVGKDYTFTLPAEKAFGKKDLKHVQMIPVSKFTKEGIRPVPGMQVNVDGTFGLVKHAGGGRVLVDFNHPLAGQDVRYTVQIKRLVTDDAEKLKALLELEFHTKDAKAWDVSVADGIATISTKKLKLPQELAEPLSRHVHEVIPSITRVIIAPETVQKQL